MFHITITEEIDIPDLTPPSVQPERIERLSLRLDTLDLWEVIRKLAPPQRKTRSDKGQRKEKP